MGFRGLLLVVVVGGVFGPGVPRDGGLGYLAPRLAPRDGGLGYFTGPKRAKMALEVSQTSIGWAASPRVVRKTSIALVGSGIGVSQTGACVVLW
jgi:hypothetical protein